MRKFTHLSAVAAPIAEANIDTDQILPGRFLKTIKREGLGKALFFSARFNDQGQERPGFILNREPWRSTNILISLDNFGCGSSREHAPWALADFGIRAIIAPSFADIFRNNCYKNGILPIILPRPVVDQLIEQTSDASSAHMSINLPDQTITTANGEVIAFEVASKKKEQLLHGHDEIAASEQLASEIVLFEQQASYCCPSIEAEIDALGAHIVLTRIPIEQNGEMKC